MSPQDFVCIPSSLKLENPTDRLCYIVILPLILHYIKKKLTNKEDSLEIFQTLVDSLNDPAITDDIAQSILHMLRIFLIYCPHPPTDLLPKIISSVKPFFVWPIIFSNSAMNVINLVSLEIKAPGAGLRSKLIEEIPLLLPNSETAEMESTGLERKVFIIFDSNCKKAKHLHELLKSFKPPYPAGSDLQLRMVSSIFESCLCIKSDSLGLEYCSPENIDMFYNEAMRILEHSVTLSDTDALQYRIQHLTELKEQITSSISTIKHFSKANMLSLAPLDIQMKLGEFGPSTLTGERVSHARHHYPKRPSFDILLEMLESYLKLECPSKPLVRIGIVGGDSTMHNVVSGVVCLRVSRPDIFEKLDIRFYFIPSDTSALGSWLSSQDSWYGKQVALLSRSIQGIYPTTDVLSGVYGNDEVPPMFKLPNSRRGIDSLSKMVNPSQNSDNESLSDDSDDIQFNPSVLFRYEIESYFRDAKWPLNLAIYRCECFKDDSSYTIPFFSRAQIGMKVSIESFKKQNNLPNQLTESEVISSKNFKFNAPTLSLKYIQMTPTNIARITGQQTEISYHTLTIASLPHPDDKENGLNANPTKPWLELMLVEDQGSKNKKKNIRDEPKCFHISQIEILGEEKFEMLLDGVLYGPFKKVKITSAMQPDKDKIISLPIMTFYQNDLC